MFDMVKFEKYLHEEGNIGLAVWLVDNGKLYRSEVCADHGTIHYGVCPHCYDSGLLDVFKFMVYLDKNNQLAEFMAIIRKEAP